MRRIQNSGDYKRSWDEFKQGFGDASGEYWLGNEYLHYITNSGCYKLRVDLEDWNGNTRYAEYSSFRVTSEADNYRLLLGSYSGDASASQANDASAGFLYQNNSFFTTYDRDNDARASNPSCIADHVGFGGFWYKNCAKVSATSDGCGSSSCSRKGKRIRWNAWRGSSYSMKKIKMMFRPVS